MRRNETPEQVTEIRKLARACRLRCIFSRSTRMKVFLRLKWRYAVLAVVLLALGSTGLVFWRAQRAFRFATLEVQSHKSLRFSVRNLAPANSNFEWIDAPETFSGAAVFRGEFYLCGDSGLFRYDSRGTLIRHYRPGQDLPPTSLLRMSTGVLKDSREPELLIATLSEGVLAFNGADFRQLLPADSDARSITSLLPLSSGQLLIGTRKRGVLVYDGQSLQAYHPALAALRVTELAGSEADLWIGTQDQGVVHWQAGRAETFAEAQGMPDAQVFSIALVNNKAYVGTAVGIGEFDGGRIARVLAPGYFARTLYVNGATLLSGGSGEGILEINPEPRRMQSLLRSATRAMSDVQQIFAEGDTLYVVTRNALYQKEGQQGGWQRVLSPANTMLTDRNISALAFDGADRLWVGFFDRGLDLVDPAFRNVTHIEDENVFCINRIVPNAGAGTVAVATANGLVLFDESGKKRQVLGRADGLIADHVTDAALYGTGMVLATPAGLTFFDAAGPRSLYAFHGLVNNHVYTVGAWGTEVVAGTLGGISILENENVAANYTVATPGLTHNWISAIVRSDNDWFVGTYGGGVVRLLANGSFEPFDIATGKFEVYPNAMLATEQHVLAGTLSKGLYVYNRGTNRWSVMTNGLPSMTVTALAAGKGLIYVGTDNGLVRIPEQNLP
jgi:hypothetical protein